MNLMSLLRLIGLVAIAWTVLALGAGVFGLAGPSGRAIETEYFMPSPALHEAVSLDRAPRPNNERPSLFDQATGRIEPLPVPPQFRWELVSVSPWRSRDGRLQAVGRWVDWSSAGGEQELYGLGLFRVPDATLVRRITLDVLPTSRPCWVPDRTGELLFSAGDGHLYRCRIADDQNLDQGDGPEGRPEPDPAATTRAQPVIWRCEEPGRTGTFLTDPVWPTDRRFKRLICVALNAQRQLGNHRTAYEPSKLWWLKMSEQGDAIVAAGRLTRREKGDGSVDPVAERSPYVAIGAGGRINLFYIARESAARGWKVHSVPLDIDPETGEPHIAPLPVPPRPLSEELAVVSLAGSADGESVYAFTESGRAHRFSVPRLRGQAP
jgi:hypothetical protein